MSRLYTRTYTRPCLISASSVYPSMASCSRLPVIEVNDDTVSEDERSQLMQLRRAVDVESVGDKVYQSVCLPKPKRYRSVYGGLVMSQALMAAVKSVSTLHSDFLLHSFHCYFVGPTQTDPPVTYKVGHAKEGRNFCSVTVKAMQSDKVNFHCMASFYKPPESSIIEYQAHPMPAVPKVGESTEGSKYEHYRLSDVFPIRKTDVQIDMVVCAHKKEVEAYRTGKDRYPRSVAWIRGKGSFNSSDPQNLHRIAIVYASDMLLARLVLNKYPDLEISLVTSLDHSVWFHCPVQADQWYLYVSDVQRATSGRSLTTCRVYSEDGTMVATCSQESLIRPKL